MWYFKDTEGSSYDGGIQPWEAMGVLFRQHCLLCAQSTAYHRALGDCLAAELWGPCVYHLCSTAPQNDRQVPHHSHSDTVIVTMCTVKWDQTHWSSELTSPVTLWVNGSGQVTGPSSCISSKMPVNPSSLWAIKKKFLYIFIITIQRVDHTFSGILINTFKEWVR